MRNFFEKHVFISIFLFFTVMLGIAWAADTKLTALTELAAAPAETDMLYIVDDEATDLSKRITVLNLMNSLEAALTGYEIHADNLPSESPTAAALTADGADCAAGSYPLGVDAAGAVANCTDATTEIDAALVTALAAARTISGNWVNTTSPWAANEMAAGTADAQGAVQLATNAQTVTGTAADRVNTPAGLTERLSTPGPIGDDNPSTGNFLTITAGTVGSPEFGVDADGDTTVASLIMPVTQDPLWWFNTTHASDTDWWIGTNADGTGDDNDAWEIRRSATPGTSVDFRTTLNGTLWITQDYEELQIPVIAWTTDTTVADGHFYFRIGKKLAGLNLVYVHAEVITAGTATAAELLTINIYNVTQTADILSTAITLDSTETGSDTADAAAVIDAAQDDMQENDVIRIDIDEIFATTASKGLIITLGFDIP